MAQQKQFEVIVCKALLIRWIYEKELDYLVSSKNLEPQAADMLMACNIQEAMAS